MALGHLLLAITIFTPIGPCNSQLGMICQGKEVNSSVKIFCSLTKGSPLCLTHIFCSLMGMLVLCCDVWNYSNKFPSVEEYMGKMWHMWQWNTIQS